jgi:hypothetical protein
VIQGVRTTLKGLQTGAPTVPSSKVTSSAMPASDPTATPTATAQP